MNADINDIHFTDDELYVLKKIWENLAEKNCGFGISKEVFVQYVQLNGLLEELLYEQFNIKKLPYIDCEDFTQTMNLLCFGTNLDHAKFLFDMCDVNKDGKVQRKLLSILLHSIPSSLICVEGESLNHCVDYIFDTYDTSHMECLVCEDFKNWVKTVPKILSYIKDHIPYNIENNLKRRQSVDKLDILPKSMENIEYESWMWKKCKRLGLLKKQYYYLHGTCLYYYKARYDLKPQGIIYLVGSLVKPMIQTARGMYAFEVAQLDLCSGEHNIHETRIFYCDSLSNRNEWVSNLQKASHMSIFEDKYYLYTNSKLGSGAFSNVYICTRQDDDPNVQYAVKIIDKTRFGQMEKEHFRIETNILKMISHENIIKTYDIFETTQTISIVTELVKDGELFNYILNRPCFKDYELKPLMIQLFNCTLYLHEHGIVHSDIKPENILYNKQTGQIKLIDFGLSKILLPNKKIEVVDGTLSYVAPEALQMNAYGHESDIWSIGVVMYLLVYGKLPFDPSPSEEQVNNDPNSVIMFNILTKELMYDDIKRSRKANNLLKKLLEKNHKIRITIKDALIDHFFADESLENTSYNNTLSK
jgi:tRNA A-37 threonylcarbamoyl transferase component Bud32/Ca2+-binding EF-hand superfamily protein